MGWKVDKKWEKIITGFDDRSIKTVLAEKQTNKQKAFNKKNSNTSQNSSNNMRWSK